MFFRRGPLKVVLGVALLSLPQMALNAAEDDLLDLPPLPGEDLDLPPLPGEAPAAKSVPPPPPPVSTNPLDSLGLPPLPGEEPVPTPAVKSEPADPL